MIRHRLNLETGRALSTGVPEMRLWSPKNSECEGDVEAHQAHDVNQECDGHSENKPSVKSVRREPETYESLVLKKGSATAGGSVLRFVRQYAQGLAFLVYLVFGTLFYAYDPENRLQPMILCFFQAVTIGYSVGLSPKYTDYIPNPWFSSCYILAGASLLAVAVSSLGKQMEDNAASNMFLSLKRHEDYERRMSRDNPFHTRILAFLKYNGAYLFVVLLWIVWLAFIVVWSMIATKDFDGMNRWNFAYAQYFAVSLSSSAGSFSLPPNSPNWAYGFAALSMMVGVPLMALAISSIVIMSWHGQKFKRVKEAAWEPVTKSEIAALDSLGLGGTDGEVIGKGGFILLGLLRMGQDGGIIKYLANVYDAAENERGGVPVEHETDVERALESGGFHHSTQAKSYLGSVDSDVETNGVVDTSREARFCLRRHNKRQWSTSALTDTDDIQNRSLSSLGDMNIGDAANDIQRRNLSSLSDMNTGDVATGAETIGDSDSAEDASHLVASKVKGTVGSMDIIVEASPKELENA